MCVRWKVKFPLAKVDEYQEQDFPGELTMVMWCQGVMYRFVCGLCLVYLIFCHLFIDNTVAVESTTIMREFILLCFL